MPAEPSFPRRHRTALISVGVVAALVVAVVVLRNRAHHGATGSSPSTTNTVMNESVGVDLSQPFLATPAAGWADGAAGIVTLAPAPVGSYTAEQVAAGYGRVRQLLVTERLDPAVLKGHDFERVLTLLAPAARAQVDMSRPSQNAYLTATRIADGFDLLPVEPKVTGTMSAAQAPDGALLIHTNYLFAYAFVPDDPAEITDPMQIVTVDRFEADYTITDDRWVAADRGVWMTTVRGFGYAVACTAYKRGELAPGFSEPRTGVQADDKKQAFDPNRPIPTTSNC
jgi:hypothetical protein